VSGGRSGGSEDLKPVSLGDRGEPRHVGVAFGRGRQDAFESRLADLSLESLELHRREADQHHPYTRLHVERAGHPFGADANKPAFSDSFVSATQTVTSPSRT